MLCSEYFIVLHHYYRVRSEHAKFDQLSEAEYESEIDQLIRLGWFDWFNHHTPLLEFNVQAWVRDEYRASPPNTFSVKITNGGG